MEKIISKEIESDLAKLGFYQIIGGVLGLIVILWNMFETFLMSALGILLYLFILLFFAYSIFCGILCLKANKNALRLSLINQILQVIGFAIMGFGFKYIAGVYFSIGLDLSESIKFGVGAGISSFNFNFNNQTERLELDFNVVAIALIYWIDKLMKKVKEENSIRQLSSIGSI